MEQQLKHIITALLIANGHETWYLGDPITVRFSVRDFDTYEIHAMKVSLDMRLFIMGGDEDGGELSLEDLNADKLIDSIYQRVMKTYPQEQLNKAI